MVIIINIIFNMVIFDSADGIIMYSTGHQCKMLLTEEYCALTFE